MKFKTIVVFIFSLLLVSNISFGQSSEEAKKLLDEVSTKMSSYKNMYIGFSQSLINLEAGIKEGDEPPIRGEVNLAGEKYRLDYLGNQFIFDGKKLYVINNDEKEISVTDGDLDDEDGFIYPSKLLTFYKQGYNFEMGKLQTVKGRKLQFVTLYPIDSNSEIVKVELAIDAKTKHIVQLIQTGENGSKTTFTITNFKSNLNLSDDFFNFDREKYLKKKYIID
jgi:outer membrane lipoprotein-sorting protein